MAPKQKTNALRRKQTAQVAVAAQPTSTAKIAGIILGLIGASIGIFNGVVTLAGGDHSLLLTAVSLALVSLGLMLKNAGATAPEPR